MRIAAALVACVSLVACSTEEQPRPEPIVVYAPATVESRLLPLFDEFTSDTRIRVSARWGNSGELTNSVIAKEGIPADVLITDNVADAWRAAEAGSLRPIHAESLQPLPQELRDADNYWASFANRTHRIRQLAASEPVGDYIALAKTDMAKRVCLSSSQLPDNRALVAALIEQHGVRGAERIVRGWVGNQALPPFESRQELDDAVLAGTCEYAIVASGVQDERFADQLPEPISLSADAVSIGRHARNPDSAQQFVAWLIRRNAAEIENNAGSVRLSTAGYRDEEARLLAERAGYR